MVQIPKFPHHPPRTFSPRIEVKFIIIKKKFFLVVSNAIKSTQSYMKATSSTALATMILSYKQKSMRNSHGNKTRSEKTFKH